MKTIKKWFNLLIKSPLSFIQTYFKSFILLFAVLIVLSIGHKYDTQANLAKIYLKGMILESESFAKQVDNLKNYPNLKGVLLIIDSPGGTLGASVEIADMIKELNEQLPVVAYVQGTMASGSYYAGMYSKAIVANRGSMIGSIGVILNSINIEDLMNKIGIKPQTLSAGEYKEIGAITRKWSEKEEKYLSNVINQQYMMFVNDVSSSRKLPIDNYKDFAEGRIFNAYDAKKVGLIDLVGTQGNAVNILQELAVIDKVIWVKQSTVDDYLNKITNSVISNVVIAFTSMY